MRELSIVEIRFMDHLKKRGCPVCSASDEAVRLFFESLFYENVNDVGVRKRFESDSGFCAFHTRIAEKFSDPSGTAILYASLLVKTDDDAGGHAGKCRCCEVRDEAVGRAVTSVGKFLENGSLFANLGKNLLFCRRHFSMLSRKLEGKNLKLMEKFQDEKLKEIHKLLNDVLKRIDYTSKTKDFTDDEMFALFSAPKYFSTFEELSR